MDEKMLWGGKKSKHDTNVRASCNFITLLVLVLCSFLALGLVLTLRQTLSNTLMNGDKAA